MISSAAPITPVNPLSPSAATAAAVASTPEHRDVYVTAPVMVPVPVVYPPPVVVVPVQPPPHRAPGLGTAIVAGAAAGVATVAVVDCCCF